ncbi:hypothetical protein ACMFMG_007831 [Clarireedia jacksonii]
MNKIPAEILVPILQDVVDMSGSDKNSILNLRLVCKAFDRYLKQSALKTIQLDFTRIHRFRKIERNIARRTSLFRINPFIENVYIDMTIVRDSNEIKALTQSLDSVRCYSSKMEDLLESLQKYCLKEATFTEKDYHLVLWRVLTNGPNLTRVQLNLPLQITGGGCRAANQLLLRMLLCIADRSPHQKKIDTLIIKHLSDTIVNRIFQRHWKCADSIFKVFENLKDLVITLKRCESRDLDQDHFARSFWSLLRKATDLQSLSISGLTPLKKLTGRTSMSLNLWNMRCLPYDSNPELGLRNLRCLELKSVEVEAEMLYLMIKENCSSLSELYLEDIYLKVPGRQSRATHDLWIGYADILQEEDECTWLAPALRDIEGLNLKVLRASKLSYNSLAHVRLGKSTPIYDSYDPLSRNRSLEERFVEIVLDDTLKSTSDDDNISVATEASNPDQQQPESHGTESYQTYHDKLSLYKTSLDGIFERRNTEASRELSRIINVTDTGIDLLSAQMDEREAFINGEVTGQLLLQPPTTDTN